MKIRMKVAISGTRDGKPWPPIGAVSDLPDAEAAAMCAAGLAAPVAEDRVERAVLDDTDVEARDTPAGETTDAPGLTTSNAPARRRRPGGRAGKA